MSAIFFAPAACPRPNRFVCRTSRLSRFSSVATHTGRCRNPAHLRAAPVHLEPAPTNRLVLALLNSQGDGCCGNQGPQGACVVLNEGAATAPPCLNTAHMQRYLGSTNAVNLHLTAEPAAQTKLCGVYDALRTVRVLRERVLRFRCGIAFQDPPVCWHVHYGASPWLTWCPPSRHAGAQRFVRGRYQEVHWSQLQAS